MLILLFILEILQMGMKMFEIGQLIGVSVQLMDEACKVSNRKRYELNLPEETRNKEEKISNIFQWTLETIKEIIQPLNSICNQLQITLKCGRGGRASKCWICPYAYEYRLKRLNRLASS